MITNAKQDRRQHDQVPGTVSAGQGIHVVAKPIGPDMVAKSLQSGFGVTKETALPRWCKECEVLAACQGGCPKHRFMTTYYGEPGLHYLCEGYKKFFLHIRKYLRAMATLLENGLPASRVMDAIKGPLVIRREE